jgi:Tn3 transposase DDE domain
MEDPLGALGLVLNCITLWNTLNLDHALSTLRAEGYPVLDADAARLSACQYRPHQRPRPLLVRPARPRRQPAGSCAIPTHPARSKGCGQGKPGTCDVT